jgi:GTP pyrophosphokinase
MENLKTDLEAETKLFVFTPKRRSSRAGQVDDGRLRLRSAHRGGHSCIGAKVNGRLVSLDQKLRSDDACEIFTSKLSPRRRRGDWLQLAVSPPGAQQDPSVVQP